MGPPPHALLILISALAAACAGRREIQPSELDPGPGPNDSQVAMVWQWPAMGVGFELALIAEQEPALELVAADCAAEVDRIEGLLNLWSPDSTLSRWNDDPAWPARPLDAEVTALLQRALKFSARSGGRFDPTIGTVLTELGHYGGPVLERIDEATNRRWRRTVGYHGVSVGARLPDGRYEVWCAEPGVRIDLSGLAKGYAAERVLALLRRAGVANARIAAGSSTIAAMGPGPDGEGWELRLPGEVQDVVWMLRDEAASTSGQSSLTIGDAGGESHIVDPITCLPIDHRTEMVVVRGPAAIACDMASTALLVMGVDEALEWIARDEQWQRTHAARFYSVPRGEEPAIVQVGPGGSGPR